MIIKLAKKILSEKNKAFLKNKFKLLYKLHLRRLYFRKYPKFLVIEVTNNWASFHLPKEVIDWMQQGF